MFTLGTSELVPGNALEHAMSAGMALWGVFMLSFCLMYVQQTIYTLTKLHKNKEEQEFLVQRLFIENQIPRGLQGSTWEVVRRCRFCCDHPRINPNNVGALGALPSELREALYQAMYLPRILKHPALRCVHHLDSTFLNHLCLTGLSE